MSYLIDSGTSALRGKSFWQAAWLAILCLVALDAKRLHGLGIRVPNQDAEAIGRGNAFAATADNPSALYYNPAGITQLQGQNFQVGVLTYFGINSEYVSPSGATSSTDYENIPVPQVYYTFSLEEAPLSFGLGIYAPFGLGLEWPEDTGFRTLSIQASVDYITVNPVIAWKLLPNLSLSAGPTFNYSKFKLRRGLFSPVPGSDYFEFDGDDFAMGANAGLLWQPIEEWSFGLNYRSGTTVNYKGTSQYAGLPAANTTAQVQFPQIASGGISYRPTTNWNFEVDLDWAGWSSFTTVTLNNTPIAPSLPLVLNWESSWMVEVGASYRFSNGYFLSAGYFFTENSVPDATFNPTVPDTNLHTVSLGGGFRGVHWRWALSGQLIMGPWRTVSGSAPSVIGQSADGQYQFFIPTLSASLGYHF